MSMVCSCLTGDEAEESQQEDEPEESQQEDEAPPEGEAADEAAEG